MPPTRRETLDRSTHKGFGWVPKPPVLLLNGERVWRAAFRDPSGCVGADRSSTRPRSRRKAELECGGRNHATCSGAGTCVPQDGSGPVPFGGRDLVPPQAYPHDLLPTRKREEPRN